MKSREHATPLLAIQELDVRFSTPSGPVHAVRSASFSVNSGETLGIVGESGSGKSVTAMSILSLIPRPPGLVTGKGIIFEGQDILNAGAARMRAIRGNRIAMVFQEPMTSLNPVFTVGSQIAEVLREHLKIGSSDAMDRAVGMLDKVGISLAKRRAGEFPHQLSGGMRQRVMIAMALALNPKVLLADEPTTALDVTIQSQIIDLMLSLQEEFSTAIVVISHDMGLISETCDRVAVMYAGQIVEQADVRDLFSQPLHPYTQGLLASIPRLRTEAGAPRVRHLQTIPGTVPDLRHLPRGCVFRSRCAHAMPVCESHDPALRPVDDSRQVACWLHAGTGGSAADPET